IKPALEEGRIVISDRFSDSTVAYQGYGRGLDLKKIEELDQVILGGLKPDLTIILDIDPHQGVMRSNHRLSNENDDEAQAEDRFERMDMGFHEKIRQAFLDIAKSNPQRCVVIDAAQSVDDITAQI